MITIHDLIKQGIIKEYIPPKAVTKLKTKSPPRAKPVLQEQFPEVFKAWCDSDISNKKSRQHSVRNASGVKRSYAILERVANKIRTA